jgi:SAM-dependent methyltransferase
MDDILLAPHHVPVQPVPEVAGEDHPSRPIPVVPPRDRALRAWAKAIDLAADAWAPELGRLIDRLDLAPGARVLDAGCGPGRITRRLAERVAPGGTVQGIDHEMGVLEYAAWSLGSAPVVGASIELGLSDVTALPFEDATIDAAWCSSVLGYLAVPEHALAELVRVVRPGGRIVVLTGDAARATFLPIDPGLETRLREAEARAAAGGAWGSAVDLHLGRRLYGLARALPVRAVEPVTVTWERAAPLALVERAYLHETFSWLADDRARRWLGSSWDACRSLFDPGSSACLLDRPDFHVIQTAAAVVIEV